MRVEVHSRLVKRIPTGASWRERWRCARFPRSNPGNRLQYQRVNGPFTLIMYSSGQLPDSIGDDFAMTGLGVGRRVFLPGVEPGRVQRNDRASWASMRHRKRAPGDNRGTHGRPKADFFGGYYLPPTVGPGADAPPARCLDTAHGGPRRRARRIPRYHYIPHHCSTAPQLPQLVALSSRGPGALRPLVAVSNGGVFGGPESDLDYR